MSGEHVIFTDGQTKFVIHFKNINELLPIADVISQDCIVVIDGKIHIGHFHCNGYFYSYTNRGSEIVGRWRHPSKMDSFKIDVPWVTYWSEK
jgi:hypothetical protein